MDAELLEGFIEEAESYMPTIRQGIELYAADAGRLEDLKTSYRQVHTIKGAALMVGLPEIGAFAKTLQDALDEIVSANSFLSADRAAALLADVARLETMFGALVTRGAETGAPAASEIETEIEFEIESEIETDDIFSFDDNLFETEAGNEFEIEAETATTATAVEEVRAANEFGEKMFPPAARIVTAEFEIDAEMLEVFALEAEEHLRAITANLSLLERNPRDREALLEIRRSAHTLKGSAGIVGFQKLSALAHAQEDLLDYLAENESAIPAAENHSVVKILLAATDCLEALSAGQNSPELEQRIAEIHDGFQRLLTRLKAAGISAAARDDISSTKIQTEIAADAPTAIETPFVLDLDEPQTPAARGSQEEKPATAFTGAPENSSASAPTPAAASIYGANHNPTVVRVSLERLDELVGLTGHLVTGRSAFEQRLSGLRRQIEELQHSTRRLQRLSGRIETDFAAAAGAAESGGGWGGSSSNGNSSGGGGGGGRYFSLPTASDTFAREQSATANNNGEIDDEFDFLELDRYTEFHQTARELTETAADTAAVGAEINALVNHLGLIFDAQRSLFDEMQDKLLRLRMVPFSTLSARLQRTVRVTADEEGKAVDFTVEGDALEIDSEILHVIVEPLLHLLRNAVAHGVEPSDTRRLLGKPENGRIALRVSSEGTHIVLSVADDGRGISAGALKEKAVALGFVSRAEAEAMTDDDAYALIFLPGLSTAAAVNQVSGRGVGMNVVKSSVTRQQGSISVKSEAQKGTSFTLRIPTALAVTRVLLVKSAGQTFAFPLKIVRRVTEISRRDFDAGRNCGTLELEGKTYAVAHLNELLSLPVAPAAAAAAAEDARVLLLLIETAENAHALAVEQILKPEEVVIKPLGAPLASAAEFLGATVLGDGAVVPILDLIPLLLRARKNAARAKNYAPLAVPETRKLKSSLSILIVDDSPSVRQINSKIVKNAGWQSAVAKDGLEALEMLEAAASTTTTAAALAELPDVILTDVEMPRMDGYELLAALQRRENLRRIPVVMITSRGGDKHRRKAFDLGVSEYLTKPYEDAVLLNAVKRLTGNV